MQIVRPGDIEDALRVDVSTILSGMGVSAACFAPPAPDNLQPNSVCFMATGGTRVPPVAYSHGVRVDCWAATDAAAMELANTVCGIIGAIMFYDTASVYPTSDVNIPYLNPDPNRPTLPRASFNANVLMRGDSITETFKTKG